MYSLRCAIVLSILAAIAYGKVVNVKNRHSTAIVVSGGDADYPVASNGFIVLATADEWTGTISAVPVDAEVTDGPRTKVDISLGASGDSYSVSLVDGFNLGVKVIPTGSANCSVAVCAANLLYACPVANQVINSLGVVVACQNSPLVMSALCPLAVVDEATAVNVQECADAVSYLVIFT